MNEGLEVWIPPEPVPSVRGLEAPPIRPLMEVILPGCTPSSTPSSSQISGSSSRLKELHDRLKLRNRNNSTREEQPLTCRDHPDRSVIIASYKKNTDGDYHRHNRVDWTTVQRARRDCFHDVSWAEYYAQPIIHTFKKVRNINEIIRQIQQRSVLPVRLLDEADMMKRSFPDDASSDGNHFDRPKGLEWLNGVFQKHINMLEAALLETAQFTFGPPPISLFFATRPLSSRLGARVDSRDSSRSSRTRTPGFTTMEAEEAESFTHQSSVVSSVVVVDTKRVERPAEPSRARYLERMKELDLEDLECTKVLAEVLELTNVSHEDLTRHHCVDWLKAHEANFSRSRTKEIADLTGIPLESIRGPSNYRPLKQLGSPGLIVEPPKHRTSIARIRVAAPAQLRVVEKLLEPKDMGLPDAAYEGSKLDDETRYGGSCGYSQLTKTLAVYDQSDPGAARVIIVAGSDFEGTSLKLFWPKTLV